MDHGTVKAEIVEYREDDERLIICELTNGWHVIEHYKPRTPN